MAKLLSPKLRVGSKDRETVDIHIDFTVDFSASEAGNCYKVYVEFHSVDRGLLTYIPPPFFTKTFPDEIVAQEGCTDLTRSLRFFRESLNEDKNGKDEMFAVVEMVPVAPRFGGRTPELQYEFEHGKGHRND